MIGTKDLSLHAAADTHPGRPHPERVIPARTWREGDFTREREEGIAAEGPAEPRAADGRAGRRKAMGAAPRL